MKVNKKKKKKTKRRVLPSFLTGESLATKKYILTESKNGEKGINRLAFNNPQ